MGMKPFVKLTGWMLASVTLCGCQNSGPRPITPGMAQNQKTNQTPAQAKNGPVNPPPFGNDPYNRPIQQPYPAQQTSSPMGGGTITPPALVNPGFHSSTSQMGAGNTQIPSPVYSPGLQSGSGLQSGRGISQPPASTQPIYTQPSQHTPLSGGRLPVDDFSPPSQPQGTTSRLGTPPSAGEVIVIPSQPQQQSYTTTPPTLGQPPQFGNGPVLNPPPR